MAFLLLPYANRLYEPLSKLPEEGDALGKLCAALASPYEEAAWVRGLGTDLQPYRPAMNVSGAHGWVLPWLAQFVGVQIPKGTPEGVARQMILERFHQKRGLPQTIIDITKSYLSGTQFVHLQERANDNPFFFRLYIYSSEAPADLTPLLKAIAAVKPGGFTFELSLSEGLTWNAALNTWDAAQGDWDQPGSPPNA